MSIRSMWTGGTCGRVALTQTFENLYRIFKEVLGEGFLLTERCDKLFFTNLVCCYRQKRTSGVANDAWYPFCARKYMGRLIQIIEPKLIIALGLQVFEALGCCENGRNTSLEFVLIYTDRRWSYSSWWSVSPDGDFSIVIQTWHPLGQSSFVAFELCCFLLLDVIGQ